MVSKTSLETANDVSKSRNVNDSERSAVKVLLKKESGKHASGSDKIKSAFFSNIDQITCFSDRIIEESLSGIFCSVLMTLNKFQF